MMDSYPLGEIPQNKYIICLCHHGIRSSKACFHLKNRGFISRKLKIYNFWLSYKAMNLLGGIQELANHMKEIPKY